MQSAMAWQRCGFRHLVQRSIAVIPCNAWLVPSLRVDFPRQQRQRFLHNRLQSAWDAANCLLTQLRAGDVWLQEQCGESAIVVTLATSIRDEFLPQVHGAGAAGGVGTGGVTVYDDYLIFQQCSKRALAKANSDPTLKQLVGENIEQGPWYEATMAVDHEGHSVMCHFPVSRSVGTANIHLRAVRYEETNSYMSYFVLPGSGEWQLLVLEALIHRPDQPNPQRIDLLGSGDAPGCAR